MKRPPQLPAHVQLDMRRDDDLEEQHFVLRITFGQVFKEELARRHLRRHSLAFATATAQEQQDMVDAVIALEAGKQIMAWIHDPKLPHLLKLPSA